MLKFLLIENFALIHRLEVEFEDGLNLITGETGSGKSILVDAVGLLVGERASQEMVRHGFDKARVEGIFALSPQHPARARLSELEIGGESDELIVRREISLSGNNKVFINGVLSTQGLLSELGTLLADIHGQHDQQQLVRPSVQLEFLDVFGGNQTLLDQISRAFRELQATRSELERTQATEQERLQRLDTLKFQIADIEKLQLRPGLDKELQEERALLASSEKRFQASQEAYQLLYERETSSLALLNGVEKNLQELARLDANYGLVMEKVRDLRYQLEEIAFELRDYANEVEFNPSRLEALEERLAEIQKARRKYGETVDDILAYCDEIQQELQELSDRETKIQELSKREDKLAKEYLGLAQRLSEKRRGASRALRERVERELADLNMENSVFTVELTQPEERATEKGIDRAEFLISPNPGEAPKPLAKIASGGELSRIVLALRSILTLEHYSKTVVFDEVDAGIGGRVASKIGEKLARLANQHQVFCVTHLPQIASYARQHFHVDKRQSDERTIVEITPLAEAARVEEIARMMAGNQMTETTRRHAEELLQTGQKKE